MTTDKKYDEETIDSAVRTMIAAAQKSLGIQGFTCPDDSECSCFGGDEFACGTVRSACQIIAGDCRQHYDEDKCTLCEFWSGPQDNVVCCNPTTLLVGRADGTSLEIKTVKDLLNEAVNKFEQSLRCSTQNKPSEKSREKTSIKFQLRPKFKTDKPRQKPLVDLWNKKGTVMYRPNEYLITGQGVCFVSPNGRPDSKKICVTHDMTDRVRGRAEVMMRKAVLKVTKGNSYEYPSHETGMFFGELFFEEYGTNH